jgi:hypothetical protein
MIAVEFEDLDLSNVSKCLGCTYSSDLLVFSQNVSHILRREEASCPAKRPTGPAAPATRGKTHGQNPQKNL